MDKQIIHIHGIMQRKGARHAKPSIFFRLLPKRQAVYNCQGRPVGCQLSHEIVQLAF